MQPSGARDLQRLRHQRIGLLELAEACLPDPLLQVVVGSDMPPNIRADYYLKQGIGQARFGQLRLAAFAPSGEPHAVAPKRSAVHQLDERVAGALLGAAAADDRSEEHTSE